MGERSAYPPGTFCWVDLSTTDPEGAKRFYGAVFGWEAEDMPVGESVYSMQRLDGKSVAAIAPQPPQQRDAGVPAMWNSYVAVEDADAVAARAGELGAGVHAPPFDVMEAGRMAVIQDPQGAYFMAWQARANPGAGLVNEPGALAWNELNTTDMDGAGAFYSELFGWTIEPFTDSPEPYRSIKNGGRNNGGIRPATPAGVPPHWLAYFATDDLDAAIGRVQQGGGEVLAGPIDIQIARIAVARDPQGAIFALYDGALEP